MNAPSESDVDPVPPGGDDFPQPTGQADASRHAVDAAFESETVPFQDAPETRDEAMDRMRHEVEQARQRVLIAQAELENFRKRTRKDYEDQLKFAALPLVEDLLLVRDNLSRAIDAAGASGSVDGLLAGVEMVAKQLDDALAKHGIKSISSVGAEFDPNFHQAISQMPSEDHPEGVVAIEATTGFEMHGRVIRPSQVVVSSGKP